MLGGAVPHDKANWLTVNVNAADKVRNNSREERSK
jgi:hypothetical protein